MPKRLDPCEIAAAVTAAAVSVTATVAASAASANSRLPAAAKRKRTEELAVCARDSTLQRGSASCACTVRVAVVSDTHGVLNEALLAGLRAAGPLDHIIHPGDVGDVQRKSRLDGLDVLATSAWC